MTLSKGTKVAVLVANGFDENNFLSAQKILQETGACVKIISTNQGLVNGWSAHEGVEGWGHNYAVDAQLNTALGADYDMLVIPGGQRSLDKLKMTAHTRRFIGSFMTANKPVAVMGDALDIMDHVQVTGGREVSAADEPCQLDHNLLTGQCDDAYSEMMGMLISNMDMEEAA